MNTTTIRTNDWKDAILRLENAGRDVRELNARIDRNRRQWQADRVAEYATETRAYPQRPNRHDD
jgi:hypothetical protein